MMSNENETVLDTFGFEYQLEHKIGQGGQGAVWTTNFPHLAIKAALNEQGKVDRDPIKVQQYQNKIKELLHLPLYGLKQLSLPIAVLDDSCGYVMRLMGGTASLLDFMSNRMKQDDLKRHQLPLWLVNNAKGNGAAAAQPASRESLAQISAFAMKGGLRLRLHILYQLADIFSQIHAHGLVFGDLSVNNVRISQEQFIVWLIDVDNLCFQDHGNIVLTKNCCAPEVFNQESGITQQSDVYAFALLAFELIALTHPFLAGRAVVNAGSAFAERENAANAGLLPWIYDENEHGNALPQPDQLHPLVLTHALLALFQQTFMAGRSQSAKLRPPMWMFKFALKQALDHTVVCPHCLMSFVANEVSISNHACPFCESKLPLVLNVWVNRQLMLCHELVGLDEPQAYYSCYTELAQREAQAYQASEAATQSVATKNAASTGANSDLSDLSADADAVSADAVLADAACYASFASIHDLNLKLELFGPSPDAMSQSIVARLVWSKDTLRIYPSAAHLGQLEYALVPVNQMQYLAPAEMSIDQSYAFQECPSMLSISKPQLQQGVYLRLPSQRQLLLQSVVL